MLSKHLVTIMIDAPVEIGFDEIALSERNDEALKSLFVEFEFSSLGKRLFGDQFQSGRGHSTNETEVGLSPDLKTIADFTKHYRFLYLQ